VAVLTQLILAVEAVAVLVLLAFLEPAQLAATEERVLLLLFLEQLQLMLAVEVVEIDFLLCLLAV
jgi:hypothetical protein